MEVVLEKVWKIGLSETPHPAFPGSNTTKLYVHFVELFSESRYSWFPSRSAKIHDSQGFKTKIQDSYMFCKCDSWFMIPLPPSTTYITLVCSWVLQLICRRCDLCLDQSEVQPKTSLFNSLTHFIVRHWLQCLIPSGSSLLYVFILFGIHHSNKHCLGFTAVSSHLFCGLWCASFSQT